MIDYYKILDIQYDASLDTINDAYKNKILEYKILPFLSDQDKNNFKEIKKANIIFNNPDYKSIYDTYINNFNLEKSNQKNNNFIRKKNIQTENILINRIIQFPTINKLNTFN